MQAGVDWLSGKQLCWKDSEGLGTQQAECEAATCLAARKANSFLACMNRTTGRRTGGGDYRLYSALLRPHATTPVWASNVRKTPITSSKFSGGPLRLLGLELCVWGETEAGACSAWRRDYFGETWQQPVFTCEEIIKEIDMWWEQKRQ